MTLRDPELRALVSQRPPAVSGALRVHELGCGNVRVDVADLHETSWHAVEIKGDTDSLVRLPGQVTGYGRVFDTAELVTTARHLENAMRVIPDWWTVTVAAPDEVTNEGAVRTGPGRPDAVLRTVRAGRPNPAGERPGLVELLWLEETKQMVREHVPTGPRRGTSRWTRHQLQQLLDGHLSPGDMRTVVTRTLRDRDGWLDATGQNRFGTNEARRERELRRRELEAREARQRALLERLIRDGALTPDGEMAPLS